MQAFADAITRGENVPKGQQFVLKPVNGEARIQMSKAPSETMPKLKAAMLFDEIGFVLDEDQYRDALMMVDLFHFYMRHQQYKKLQPKKSPKEAPREWFLFAGNAVLSQIHDRNRRWSWSYFKERRDDRIKYLELFKKRKKETATPADTEELDTLEKKTSYEDLRFWRSLARNQLKKERSLVKKPAKQNQQGWIAWAWGTAPKKEEEHENEDETVMTDQQRKELYDAIDWDEKKIIAESVDLPRESAKMQIEASLKTGSFTLKRDPHGKANEILSLLFDTFKVDMLQRPDSLLANMSLGALRVYDGTTPGSLFPQIVRVKTDNNRPGDSGRIQELDDTGYVAELEEDTGNEAFFQASFEQNPLDESADSAVTIKLKSMEIIYNPKFIEEIVKFFKPPERHMESISALMESAGATVEAVRQQTRAGLEFALEEHKTLNAKLDLRAPLIIIPESLTVKETNCLIIDAGHVSLTSDLVSKDAVREIQAKQNTQYTDDDYQKLESLMYDKFILKLESTQVLIGPSIEETVEQLTRDESKKHLHIVDRINIDFTVEISIIPKAPNLTKFRIMGNMPVLHVSISDKKYKTLMKIIDVAIPKFGDESIDEMKTTRQQLDTGEAKEKAKHRRPSKSAFQFSSQMHELVLPDEDSDHEESNEKYEDVSAGTSVRHNDGIAFANNTYINDRTIRTSTRRRFK